MSEPQWTPGPWRVEDGTSLVWGACNPEDRTSYGMGSPVAEGLATATWKGARDIQCPERIANAHLIASAPTLYAALSIANIELAALVADPSNPDFGPATRNDNPADVDCLLKAFETIRDAMAAARGEGT